MKTSDRIKDLVSEIHNAKNSKEIEQKRDEIVNLIRNDPKLEIIKDYLNWHWSINNKINDERNSLNTSFNEVSMETIIDIVKSLDA